MSKAKSPDLTRSKAYHDGKYNFDKCLITLRSDPSMNVRLEAFYRIMREASYLGFVDAAIRAGLNDSYEMLRRMAARYAENYGAPELLELIANHYLDPQESSRVRYHLLNAFSLYPADDVEQALRKAWDGTWPAEDEFESTVARICGSVKSSRKDIDALLDDSISTKDKAFTISHQRNADSAAAEELRLKAAEALGWYTHSCRRQEIYSRLKALDISDAKVADEVHRTLRRLEDNAHTK